MTHREIQELFVYTDWARHRILDAVAQLPVAEQQRDRGISHSSIHGTLVHMLGAEWVWLERFLGRSPTALLNEADFPDLATISERWRVVEADRKEYLASLNDEAMTSVINFASLKCEVSAFPLAQLLLHVINHATHHRGQITGMIRQLGIAPPVTDLIWYMRNH